jgi:hypothetical protein
MINEAAQQGIVVFLDPIETGGWLTTLENNGATAAYNYGVYVGNRYKNFPNIVWLSGNDFQTWYSNPGDNNLVKQVMAGIASVDPSHLQTLELNYSQSYSNQDTTASPYLGLDLVYTYFETYDAMLQAYNSTPAIPTFMGESDYEGENVTGQAPSTPMTLRLEEYWTMTSGGTGELYGSVYTDRIANGWSQANIDSRGVTELGYFKSFFSALPWYNLVPDQAHAVVTAGYGTYTTYNSAIQNATYATTAWNPNGTLAVTYVPTSTTLTVNMAKFGGSVTARWFDPSAGTYTAISGSPFANTSTHNFATPGANFDGNEDWVLLLQASSTPH